MLQWIKCIGTCLCVVAFVMNVGLADKIDEKVRLANELDIETGEAMIKSRKAWIEFYEAFIKDKEKRFLGEWPLLTGKKEEVKKEWNKMKLYQEYIIRDNAIEAKKHIKEINASLERLREYIEELKAKSINELITLYSEGKEKGKSFEEIIKDAKKGIAEDKKKIADIQKRLSI